MGNVIEFRNITKYFPGVKALDDISFTANGGEVLALMGENGAGKSTLLKVLNGDYQQTSGEYLVNGEPCHFNSPREAVAAGIGVIYQERQIMLELTVGEIFSSAVFPPVSWEESKCARFTAERRPSSMNSVWI